MSSEETKINEDTNTLSKLLASEPPEDEEEFYDCFSTEDQPSEEKATEIAKEEVFTEERISQMKADNTKAKVPTLMEATILDSHLQNEGNNPMNTSK